MGSFLHIYRRYRDKKNEDVPFSTYSYRLRTSQRNHLTSGSGCQATGNPSSFMVHHAARGRADRERNDARVAATGVEILE